MGACVIHMCMKACMCVSGLTHIVKQDSRQAPNQLPHACVSRRTWVFGILCSYNIQSVVIPAALIWHQLSTDNMFVTFFREGFIHTRHALI